MKIVVLAGGTSTERDVSIVSGKEVALALEKNGHQVILLDVFFGCGEEKAKKAFKEPWDILEEAEEMKKASASIKESIAKRRAFIGENVISLCQEADVVFMALHGQNGEDGKLQAAFDLFGINYTGTGYLSSAIAMDKGMTKQFFMEKGIPTPKGAALKKGEEDLSYKRFGMKLPVIVKPCCGGSSVGVTIAHSEEEYEAALKEAFSYEDELVVEEYISGREFSVAVIADKAYPIVEIAPLKGFYNFENKYKAGSTIETCPAQISEEMTKKIQQTAVKGARALGITGYSRLDFMMDEEENIYCLEANTLPGMTPTSLVPQEAAALGIDFPQLCELLIEISKRDEK